MLPVNILPNEKITLSLTYEYLLERTDNLYTHALSISPGEIVPDFQIRMVIKENRPLTGVRVVAPVIGDVTDQVLAAFTDRWVWFEFGADAIFYSNRIVFTTRFEKNWVGGNASEIDGVR